MERYFSQTIVLIENVQYLRTILFFPTLLLLLLNSFYFKLRGFLQSHSIEYFITFQKIVFSTFKLVIFKETTSITSSICKICYLHSSSSIKFGLSKILLHFEVVRNCGTNFFRLVMNQYDFTPKNCIIYIFTKYKK